jgi:ABC-2 type transport system ATP-binding protein
MPKEDKEMEPIIKVKDLKREFKVPKKLVNPSKWKKFISNFKREWETKEALKGISFEVKKGEFIGYVGANGSGKTTTIKILTGIMSQTSGEATVLGYNPQRDRYEYTYNIGVTFGQRTLLSFDIPVIESMKIYAAIYELDKKQFKKRLDKFAKILKIDDLLQKPVRKLSLGERMRCEIAASLIHNPKIVYLDEPTIGLDAIAKEEIRKFLREMNKKEGVTVMLTTHDMEDIEELCKRIIFLHEGKIIYDGDLDKLKKRYMTWKRIEFDFKSITSKAKANALKKKVKILHAGKDRIELRVDLKKQKIKPVIDNILSAYEIVDLSIHEPRLENIVREIYKENEK